MKEYEEELSRQNVQEDEEYKNNLTNTEIEYNEWEKEQAENIKREDVKIKL